MIKINLKITNQYNANRQPIIFTVSTYQNKILETISNDIDHSVKMLRVHILIVVCVAFLPSLKIKGSFINQKVEKEN